MQPSKAGAFLFTLFLAATAMTESQAQAFAATQGSSEDGRLPNDAATAIPQLPAPDGKDDSTIPSIRLGETIQLTEMGPIILNTDGSTRRIQNWDSMTEREQQVTWKRISKRNEERRKKLLEEQQAAEEEQQQQQDEL